MKVAVQEAKEHLEELLEAAAKGEEVVILKDGTAFRLSPAKKRGGYGALPALYIADDFDAPLQDFKEYMLGDAVR